MSRKKKIKNKSILRQALLFPALVMMLVLAAAICLCVFSVYILGQRSIENTVSSLKITFNQLKNELDQIDEAFIEYWNQNDGYRYLSLMESKEPVDMFLEYQMETVNWMKTFSEFYPSVAGAFVYYENLDLLLFRGASDWKIHDYVSCELMSEGREYNHWEFVTLGGEQYLITIKNYKNFYGGVWLPVSELYSEKNLNAYDQGVIYMMDASMANTARDSRINDVLLSQGTGNIIQADKVYNNYQIGDSDRGIYLGLLVPRGYFWDSIPTAVKGIFLLLLICAFLFPVVLLWLKRKVIRPIRILDRAMKIAGEGDLEYRISDAIVERPNELERLMSGFNRMMDEITALEVSLYKTKIREQKIKLKYISQMIQPHFVLNALNIMYTYKENEFPLIKKMIRYLMEYFRYIVYLKADFVTLEQEMRHIENYLSIQKERYMDAFDFFVEWESGVSDCHIPPLIIQTFAENCLKYGKRENAQIFVYVLASESNGRLKLMIADSGNGFAPDVLKKISGFIETREYCDDLGIGIQNAIERMDILYGEKTDVQIHNAMCGGAVVELFLPMTL